MPRTTCLNSDSALPCTDGPRLERLGQEAFQIVHLCARPQRNAERVVADAALPTLFWGFECEGPGRNSAWSVGPRFCVSLVSLPECELSGHGGRRYMCDVPGGPHTTIFTMTELQNARSLSTDAVPAVMLERVPRSGDARRYDPVRISPHAPVSRGRPAPAIVDLAPAVVTSSTRSRGIDISSG